MSTAQGSERPDATSDASPSTWLSQGERGSLLGLRLAIRLATLVGRRPMRPLVCAIALWYRLFDRAASRASRDWWQRVHGEPPGFWQVYRHFRTFAQVTLDRVLLLTGETGSLSFTNTGNELLHAQVATGRGAVLLGAHLGSYEALCASGAAENTPIQILGYFKNARMINALFEQLNPEQAARVNHLGDDPVGVMAKVRARLEGGELVALLGDRVGLNDRVVMARFFGEPAPFAAGPFLLASVLRCPVYLCFGLYSEPNRYDLHCELFASSIDIPRKNRTEALQQWVQAYADRLEAYGRAAPGNWFNFFDFWRAP